MPAPTLAPVAAPTLAPVTLPTVAPVPPTAAPVFVFPTNPPAATTPTSAPVFVFPTNPPVAAPVFVFPTNPPVAATPTNPPVFVFPTNPPVAAPVAPVPTGAPATNSTGLKAVVEQSGFLSRLNFALEKTGLDDAISEPNTNLTLLAPWDLAFGALDDGVFIALLLEENEDLLTELLSYHVIPQEIEYDEFVAGPLNTVLGETVDVTLVPSPIPTLSTNSVNINDAKIILQDFEGSNGQVQIIDTVLIPPGFNAKLQARLSPAPTAAP